ncbi:AraC family transcriptional regulator [Ewingella americana]|uniref:AraC family transcriptional regulator n=1 Tax=Ewingella americana TaxID=41202 RepID=UPI001639B857|nr:helix-turn-helix transcriptional regulator [Ewingella americana]QMV51038.1 AraC family transcriptional regulator [Ewingella americana]
MPQPRFYPPVPEQCPNTLLFRGETILPNSEYVCHSHPWSQLITIKSGVMAMKVEGARYLAPREFAIWIPAGVKHSSYNRRATRFCAIDIAPEWDDGLPQKPCLLTLTPIFNAIANDFALRKLAEPQSDRDMRMALVLLDQICQAPRQNTYLPTSDNKLLSQVLNALEKNPADNTSLAEWAARVYTTERTLSRRCQQDLGMGFAEWRQRLRFLHSISLLEQGKTVQDVALEVGYSSSSAFIAMFQQISGTTPQRFRNER